MDLHPDLSPALVPVAWMIGTWRGLGVGGYPTIEGFRFSQELDPGTYRVTVFHQDMSGRTEEPQNADSKVFTVR